MDKKSMHLKNRVNLVVLILLCITLISLISHLPNFEHGKYGSFDFIQYWSADKLENPYDSSAMFKIQKKLGLKFNDPIMMWQPPSALILLKPFLIFDFKTSSLFFILFNIFSLIFSSYLLQLSFRKTTEKKEKNKKLELKTILTTLLFLPAWECINYGQTSIYLLLFISIFIFFFKKENYIASALALIPLSIKPHLFIIFGASLLFWILKNKKFKFLFFIFTALILLLLATYLKNINSISYWLEAIRSGGDVGAIQTQEWMPATIGTWLRILLGQEKTFLMWAPTIIGLFSIFFISFKKDLTKVIGITLLCSPYTWYYDQSILLILQIYLIYNNGLAYVLLIQFLYFTFKIAPLFFQQSIIAQHHYTIFLIFWFFALIHHQRNHRSHQLAQDLA